jgi:hypothetical protein
MPMSQTLEHIKEEIKTLRPAERFDLWRDLGKEFDPPLAANDTEETVEAAWDAEIDARVKEVQEGKVELVSADESVERIRTKLAARRSGRTSAK